MLSEESSVKFLHPIMHFINEDFICDVLLASKAVLNGAKLNENQDFGVSGDIFPNHISETSLLSKQLHGVWHYHAKE